MTGDDYELAAIVSDNAGASRVADGHELLQFVDAALTGSEVELSARRNDLRAAVGDAAFVDVCATVASFNAVVKLADGSGIPLEDAKAERTRELRAELGIDDLRS